MRTELIETARREARRIAFHLAQDTDVDISRRTTEIMTGTTQDAREARSVAAWVQVRAAEAVARGTPQ